MNFKRILPLVALFMATYASAQVTYTGTIGQHSCGRVTSGVNCWGIPSLMLDGNTLVNEYYWISYYGTPTYISSNFITFPEGDPLGLTNPYGFGKFTSPLPVINTSPGTQSLTMTFGGLAGGVTPYNGTITLLYTTYEVSGRGGGTYWIVTGGTVSITVGEGSASTDSPIAPTPTCMPGDPKGCPSHDWGN